MNNVYDGFGITRQFLTDVFGRNSLDNKGFPLSASVHYLQNTESLGFNNAYWDGKRMVFGDGDGVAFHGRAEIPFTLKCRRLIVAQGCATRSM